MANDLFSTVKSYISKVADGERTPAELATAMNAWIKESTESIKIKVEEEVTRSVSKMGFIERAEFDELKAEVARLRVGSSQSPSEKKNDTTEVKPKKRAPSKKTVADSAAKPAEPRKAKSSKASSAKKKATDSKPTKPASKPASKTAEKAK